jgi:carboxyl-terminal processing protease
MEAVRAAAVDSQEPQGLPLDELRVFAEVFGRIKSDYVEQVGDRDLLSSAIRGMLAGLDPHSAYLDPDQYEDLQVGTSGEFGGLGIEVGMEDGFVKVIAPIDDTPAQRAGIEAGDLIVRIGDKPVKGMSLGEAVELMRGEPGSALELTLMREGEAKPLQVELERAVIKVASVKQRLLDPGFGYLRVANFQARTTDDLLEAVAALEEENQGPLKGVVLDLRNNPGGVLNSAVGVSDAFLEQGLIVYTEGRMEDARLEFRAGPDDVLDGAPMVVLVNGGSASASEIVAGALQDQRRAVIMGNETFGKGSVQTIIPVDDKTALKLTTARYYTPAGRSIQALGIVPDIVLERGSLTLASEPEVAPLKEANLMRHLDDGGEQIESVGQPEEQEDKPLAAEDYQLSEALNVLRALVISGAGPAADSLATKARAAAALP